MVALVGDETAIGTNQTGLSDMKFIPSISRPAFLLTIAVIIVLSSVLRARSQENDWRPVTPGELALEQAVVEPGADAEAIFWETSVFQRDGLVYSHYVRLKIFTENGRQKYSKIDIPANNEIKNLAARVIHHDGSVFVLNKKDFFDRSILQTKYLGYKVKSFAVPNLDTRSIIEYRYDEIHSSFRSPPLYTSMLPQLDITNPVSMSAYGGSTPFYYRLNFQTKIPAQRISYTVKLDGGIDKWKVKARNMIIIEGVPLNEKTNKYVFEKKGVPALKSEPYMPPESQTKQFLQLFKLESKTEDVKDVWALSTLGTRERLEYIKKTGEDGDVIEKARTLTTNATTKEEKIRLLYDYCQKEFKNLRLNRAISHQDYFKAVNKNDKPNKILETKQGSPNQIRQLFAGLANSLGFETQLILGYDRTEYFFDEQNSAGIILYFIGIAVKIGDGWRIVDPADPYLPFGMLPWYKEGITALGAQEGAKEALWVKIPMATMDKTRAVRTGRFTLSDDGTLEGELKIEYHGYLNINEKTAAAEETLAERERNFKDEIKTRIGLAEVSDIRFENLTEVDKSYTATCRIRVLNYAQKTGRRFFFQPSFFEYGSPPTFVSSTRTYPVYIPFPWSEDDDITFELPKGYSLETTDPMRGITDPDGISLLTFNAAFDADRNVIKFQRRFYFGKNEKTLFSTKVYPSLKALFDAFKQADSRVMIFRKK